MKRQAQAQALGSTVHKSTNLCSRPRGATKFSSEQHQNMVQHRRWRMLLVAAVAAASAATGQKYTQTNLCGNAANLSTDAAAAAKWCANLNLLA